MRLGGCILLELALGATLAAGAGLAVSHARKAASAFLGEAHAASRIDLPSQPTGRLPTAVVPERLPPNGYFLGVKDEILLTPLAGDIARAKFNRGGSTLSLRLDFIAGGRASFKPEQVNGQFPRMEVAAYRLDRLLGINSVSPSIPIQFRLEELIERLDEGSRDVVPRILADIPTDEAGRVTGELQWWIPVIKDAEIEGFRLDSPEGMKLWKRYLKAGEPEPYEARHLLPQVSSMVVFDYLINNRDRWSGANCKASPDRRTLYFMDHTLAFGSDAEPDDRVQAMLGSVEKFSRSLVRRVRKLEEGAVRAAMTANTAPYPRILTEAEIAGVLYRRAAFLAYVDGLIAAHGRDAVLVYP